MIARMRAEAPTSLVFIDTTGLDGGLLVTGLQKPTGDGFVFAPHFYPLSHTPESVAGNMQNWLSMSASWNVPLFIGEMGEGAQTPGVTDYMAAHWAAFDANGAVGGAWWEYSVATELWNSEMNTVVAPDGTELPVASTLIRPFARAVAGNGLVQSFDPTTSIFALSYSPDANQNVTAIDLPARAYLGGMKVVLTGGCYDVTSQPGQMLVQADEGATTVSLTVSPAN